MPVKLAWGLEPQDLDDGAVVPPASSKPPAPRSIEAGSHSARDVPTTPTAIEAWLDAVPAHGAQPARRYTRRLAPLAHCPSVHSGSADALITSHVRTCVLDASKPSPSPLYSPTTSGSESSEEDILTECASPTDSEATTDDSRADFAAARISAEPTNSALAADAACGAGESPNRDGASLICACDSFCDHCALHWDRSIHEAELNSAEGARRRESRGEDHASPASDAASPAGNGGGTAGGEPLSDDDTGIFSLTQIGGTGGLSSTCFGLSTVSADDPCVAADPFPKPFGWAGWRRGELLGRGAHGSVFLAWEEGPDARTAAAKVVSLACAIARKDESRDAAQKLQVEVDLLRRLRRHEHIVE